MPVCAPVQAAAKRAGDAPAEKLAAKERPRFVVTRMTETEL